jgi:GntR family transcriptional repressor for pyruvate dehydrogenase complex
LAMTQTGLPNLAPPAHRDTSIAVARSLLDYLLTSELRPGDRLPSERELSDAAGVSRSVIREALKALGFLGLLDVRPGDGTYLASTQSALLPAVIEWGVLLGEKPTHDVIEARMYLEIAAARGAALRRSDEDISELGKHLDTMDGASHDPDRFRDADVAFHLGIARASGNVVFANLLSSMQSLLEVWSTRTLAGASDLSVYYEEHRAVYEAIERRDVDGAATAMEAHMQLAIRRIEAVMDAAAEAEVRTEA